MLKMIDNRNKIKKSKYKKNIIKKKIVFTYILMKI